MSPVLFQTRRAELEARIEELVSLLDMIDGDPDFEAPCDDDNDRSDYEPTGDEADTSFAEDEFHGRVG